MSNLINNGDRYFLALTGRLHPKPAHFQPYWALTLKVKWATLSDCCY